MLTLKASTQGLARIRQAREQKGWAIEDPRWLIAASQCLEPNINWEESGFFAEGVALGTFKRFLAGRERIKPLAFQAYCQVLGLNWKEVAELEAQNPVSSSFYVERVPNESRCYEAITQPGAFIRIKAPEQMGKTWLLERITYQVENLGYQKVIFDFNLFDSNVFNRLLTFSQSFCVGVSRQLGLPNRVAEYWDDMSPCNLNSTSYFQNYLLAQLTSPLVLALNKVDIVFEHSKIADDFCKLLRAWHQQGRRGDDIGKIWQRLRLIVVHSTDVYGSLDINHSPLSGVGTVVQLQEFNPEQVQDLAQRYGLIWNAIQVNKLMDMVGGHPYLVNLALESIARTDITLERVLETASQESGIYSDHLRRLLGNINENLKLATALKEVVTSPTPVQLEPVVVFKLYSMGLVKISGNDVTPRCNLYRQYFGDRLK